MLKLLKEKLVAWIGHRKAHKNRGHKQSKKERTRKRKEAKKAKRQQELFAQRKQRKLPAADKLPIQNELRNIDEECIAYSIEWL